MAINTVQQAAYIAKISGSLGEAHPYFAEGAVRLESFIEDYLRLIDAAVSERARTVKGLIERDAEVLRRALAGETYEQIAETGGANGQEVTSGAIQQIHARALRNLKEYVHGHRQEFDKSLLDRISGMVDGRGYREATAYERFLYASLLEQRALGVKLKKRVAGLEEKLADASGTAKAPWVIGTLSRPDTTSLTPIKYFGVPTLYENALLRMRFEYAEQLREYTREELNPGSFGNNRYRRLKTPDGRLVISKNIGKVGLRFIETALGYLGYGFKGSEPKPFPTGEALRQSPTGLILPTKFVVDKLSQAGIRTIGELVARQDELPALLRSKSGQLYRSIERIMTYYQAALEGLRTE
ncbi:hypothetical protein HYV82_00860 [Candidatus Woesearchaeota archaeon]|nr:hypothetical protein [Candidatus Woesearchaeota archaeon]